MDVAALYRSKLTSAAEAVAVIPSHSRLCMGMAMAQPPALLQALAERAEKGGIEDLRVYYFEATSIAGKTILRYDLNDRIRPWSARPAHRSKVRVSRTRAARRHPSKATYPMAVA